MSNNIIKQDEPKRLSWRTRKAVVRYLLAELEEDHRHQLVLGKLRYRQYAPSNTAAGFVLEHGIGWYGAPLPQDLRQSTDQPDFAHAYALALRDPSRFIYCEGFVAANGLFGATHYAWVLDRDNGDHVVNCTERDPQLFVYLGVPLAPAFVREFVSTKSGVLDELSRPVRLRGAAKKWRFPDTASLARDFSASRMNTEHLVH